MSTPPSNNIVNPFATPPQGNKIIGSNKSANDISDFLKEDTGEIDLKADKKIPIDEDKDDEKDEVKPPKKEAKKAVKDDDADDEDADEIKLASPDEDEDEKIDLKSEEADEEISAPPRKKDVTAKYPDFFKQFPWFEKMMFRDRQYTELFGSFDDAKEVADRSKNLEEFETDLLSGKTERVLASVKSADAKAWDKIVDDYLPALNRVDKEAYFEVVGNVARYFIKGMFEEGKKSENNDLQGAAAILNQYLFGTSTYTAPKQRVAEEKNEESQKLTKEREDFARERFDTVRVDLQTKVDNTLKATISEYIDPKGEMSSYVKKNAIRDALMQVHELIGGDAAFRRNLDKLWEASFSERLSTNSVNRIRSTYLGKAKNVLGAVIKKARAEALKDATPSRKVKDEDEEETPRTRRGPIPAGRPRQSSGNLQRSKGESVLDFLSRD